MKNFSLSLLILFLFTNCLYSQDTITWIPEKSIANAEYIKCYEKFKRLFIAHLESESYVNYKTIRDDFFAKIKFDYSTEESNKIMGATDMSIVMDIVAANIDKTEFKTFEEVEAESKKVNASFIPVLKENKEYFDYLKEMLKLDFGNKMLADAFEEVMRETPEKF